MAESEKGKKKAEADKRIYIQQQEATAIEGENAAKADIAKADAELAVKRAEAEQRGEVAKRQALVEIQKAQYRSEMERLNAEEIAKKEIQKREIEIAAEAEAIKNLKIDKITVWDSGGDHQRGTTTANFLSGFVKSLPPLHDIAEMAGLDLPKYLGAMVLPEKEKEEKKGGSGESTPNPAQPS